MSETVINASHIQKVYKLYDKPSDRLRETLLPFLKSTHKDFYALNDISFTIGKGEAVGIIGTNGSGKSTLLKILTGVLSPSAGAFETRGKIAALLELGAGFNNEYTGMENIYINGTIMGFSHEEMEKKVPEIIRFADIGDFINQPVKSYSSGMFVRLAFAVQIFTDPDILIVDEALSVGDLRFQQKCYRAMEALMREKTVILVTHDPAAVLRFCSRVLWIERGELKFDGPAKEALDLYQRFLIEKSVTENAAELETSGAATQEHQNRTRGKVNNKLPPVPAGIHPKGSGQARITHCALIADALGVPGEMFEPGQAVTFAMRVHYKAHVNQPIVGITIRNRLGEQMLSLNSCVLKTPVPQGSGICEYAIRFTMPILNQGEYTISPAVARGEQNDHIQLCWLDDACIFQITKRLYDVPGVLYMDTGTVETMQIDK